MGCSHASAVDATAGGTKWTFNHLDPDGTRNKYTDAQSAILAKTILKAPHGGSLQVPGLEGRFEVRWGTDAKNWKPAVANSGMYQINVTNKNLRLVEVTQVDQWLVAYEQALMATDRTKKACRYGARCYNKAPEHRARFVHPDDGTTVAAGPSLGVAPAAGGGAPLKCMPAPTHKVQLITSELFSIPFATAYHTSIMIDGKELSFSDSGLYRCQGPLSHNCDHYSNKKVIDMGLSPETEPRTFEILRKWFQRGTYDLLKKNCNSFSDLALYFLLQQRLSLRYRVLERCGATMPGMIQKVTADGYQQNDRAADFDKEAILAELDNCADDPSCAGPTSAPLCKQFTAGSCSNGEACTFAHSEGSRGVRCVFFAKNTCKFGAKCNFLHSTAALAV